MHNAARNLVVTLSVVLGAGALAQPAPQQIKGTVVEKLDAGGYSYLRLNTGKAEEWAAVPQVNVAKDAVVTIDVQARMQNFESKSLKRSWPVIIFGTVAGPQGAPPPMPVNKDGVPNPHATGLPKTVSTPPVDGVVVERLEAGVYTYLKLKTASGETWAAVPKAEVAVGAQVRIRNPQPMDGFQSPSLKRTFDRIIFGTLDAPPPAPSAPTK
ncbi:MAG: hypothetical protein JNJ54_29575 [Myxococcaceae bacterium]|nr:hypothetical protein [Myxococcaceae bacterium]